MDWASFGLGLGAGIVAGIGLFAGVVVALIAAYEYVLKMEQAEDCSPVPHTGRDN